MRQVKWLVAVAATAFVVVGGVQGAMAVGPTPDHQLCYRSKAAPDEAVGQPVLKTIVDQFEGLDLLVGKPVNLCNPATKKHLSTLYPPAHPAVHFAAYQIKRPKGAPKLARSVHTVVDQFGTLQVETVKAEALFLRASKTDLGTNLTSCTTSADCDAGDQCIGGACVDPAIPAPPGPGVGVDNYKCYKVRKAPGAARFVKLIGSVEGTDQFGGPFRIDLLKPTRLCAPANVNNENPLAETHTQHLMCYQVRLTRTPAQPKFIKHRVAVSTTNSVAGRLDVLARNELCVPAYKDPVGGTPTPGGPTGTPSPSPTPTRTPTATPTPTFTAGGPSATPTATATATPTPTSTGGGGPSRFDLVIVPGGGACGAVGPSPVPNRLAGNPSTVLTCGGLNIGGGASTNAVPEGLTPSGSTNRFALNGCVGGACNVGPVLAGESRPGGVDCSDTGCAFGVPLPINGSPKTCVANSFSAPASGTIDLTTGVASLNVTLAAHTWVTSGTVACPQCTIAVGSQTPVVGGPGAPAAGFCNRGARSGLACTSYNPQGLTKDCLPGGSDGSTDVGSLAIDLSPLTTGTTTRTDAGGLFCASLGQGATQHGCFKSPACQSISAVGSPAGALVTNVATPITLGTVFCIPASTSPLGAIINGGASLPGPGQTTLKSTIKVLP